MRFKLHIAETKDFSPIVMNQMRQHFDLSTGPVNDLKTLLEQVDVFWFRLGYQLNNSVLTRNTKCKILATPVTGIDHIDEDLCEELGIRIICLRGQTEFLKEVRATAEHSIMLAMMLMRKASHAANHVISGNWERDLFRGYELYKKKVGILGLGRLGSIVGKYYEAMGCEIFYYDIKDVDQDFGFIRCDNEIALVQRTDIVSIHIPLNKETEGIYGHDFFEAFNAKKWLINTARGGVINEDVLIECLENKGIAGAALDVVRNEPKIDGKLIRYASEHENLIITPHIGGNTYESFEKTEQFIADKICEMYNITNP